MKTRHGVAAAVLVAAMASAPAYAIMRRDYSQDIVRHQTELRACAGDRRGTVTIEIDVNGRGRVSSGSVVGASSAEMREVGACVLREARSWSFQQSSSGSTQRFVLAPTGRVVEVRRPRPPPPG